MWPKDCLESGSSPTKSSPAVMKTRLLISNFIHVTTATTTTTIADAIRPLVTSRSAHPQTSTCLRRIFLLFLFIPKNTLFVACLSRNSLAQGGHSSLFRALAWQLMPTWELAGHHHFNAHSEPSALNLRISFYYLLRLPPPPPYTFGTPCAIASPIALTSLNAVRKPTS